MIWCIKFNIVLKIHLNLSSSFRLWLFSGLSVTVSHSLSPCSPVCLHVHHPVYLPSHLSVPQSLSPSICLPLSRSLSPWSSICHSVSVPLPVSLSLSLCSSVSVGLRRGALCQDYTASGWPTWTPVVGKQNVPLSTKPL